MMYNLSNLSMMKKTTFDDDGAGTTYCNGVWATSGISGGSSVSLGTYTGNNW